MKAKSLIVITFLAVLTLLLSTAATAQGLAIILETRPPGQTQTTRQGAWLDSLVFSQQTSPSTAISQLQANELDVYAYSMSTPTLFQRVLEDPNLTYSESYGSYNELTFNPYGPTFNDGRLNPFSNARIREAMNWLVDRDRIAQEIYGGLARPIYTPILPSSADYARYRSTIATIEATYAYSITHAQQVIADEMTGMGAVLQNGVWTYNGQPITLIFLIRVEDERRQIGDYVADQLEQIGFVVDRQYKTRTEASPIWLHSNPAEGLWHIYTGGWLTTQVSRDDASNFAFFYTPLGLSSPLWQAYNPTSTFYDVCLRLWNNDFTSMAERNALFEQALNLAMNDSGPTPQGAGSLRVWLVNQKGFTPRRAGTVVASDIAGGLTTPMFPYVARFDGVEGGTMRIAQPDLLVEPWNPIAGSRWIYDAFPIRATQDYALLPDPNTALYWPQRIESAACVVKEGLPVTRTLNWVSLDFAPTITVPTDAWADWDASSQTFITAGNMPTPTLEANVKCTVVYPADLFSAVTWHDGSPLDLADFVMGMILTFDRGKPESAIYDQSYQDVYDSFMSHFRGVKIESTNPLVITTWDDDWSLDAEWLVNGWWPNYSTGPGAWHNLTPAIRAEAARQLAFSAQKANQMGVEWTNYIAGPSLGILENWMNQSANEHYIPYQPTLGAYITQAEADARWANLQAWYAARGHFWLGTGPFYLAAADWDAKTLTLERYTAFPDPAGKWDAFAAPLPPYIVINHEGGAPGSYFNVTGSGFPPDSKAFIVANGRLLGEVTSNSSGEVAFTLATDQADPGEYHVRVSVNPVAGIAFNLDPDLPLQPREGELPLVVVPAGLIPHNVYLPLIARNSP
jgi:peptide/nickel transport system substrate-binding protein